VRFIEAGQFEHPMHLHGMPFTIVATYGYPVPEAALLTKDVIPVHPASALTWSLSPTTQASGFSTATSSTTSRTMMWSRAGCCSWSTSRSNHGKQCACTDDDAPGLCNGATLALRQRRSIW
jgi:hypothetical protein